MFRILVDRAGVDHVRDMVQVPMRVFRLVHHVHLGGAKSLLPDFPSLKATTGQTQRSQERGRPIAQIGPGFQKTGPTTHQ